MVNFCQIGCLWFLENLATKHTHHAYYSDVVHAERNHVVVEILFLVNAKTLFTLCALVTCHGSLGAQRCILGALLGIFKRVLH